jgi:copper chaperone CopZ
MKTTINECSKNNFAISCKNLYLGMLLSMATLSIYAQVVKNKNAKYTVEVNGNCEQCQKRIQKAAFSISGVKMANWSVETHKLVLTMNEEKAAVEDVKKAIVKVGHDVGDIKATDEQYKRLPDCCQYDRIEPSK